MDAFTDDQKRYLIENWRRDDFDWLYQIGMRIYSKIFELAPSAKQLFPYVVQYEAQGRDWTESREFQNQALRFVQAIGKGVSSLEDEEERKELDKWLYDLGKIHQRLASRGFVPDYWNIFEIAVSKVMREEMAKKTDSEKSDLYALLANYIILQMKKGFHDISDQ